MRSSPTPVLPLLIVGACLAGVFFFVFDQQPRPGSKPPRIYTVRTEFSVQRPTLPPAELNAWLESQVAVLSSRELLLHVAYRLSLDQYWKMSADDAVARLKRHLTFQLNPGTNILTVTGRGDNLNDYLDIIDAVRDAYEEFQNNEALEAAARRKRKPPEETSIKVLEIAKEVKPDAR